MVFRLKHIWITLAGSSMNCIMMKTKIVAFWFMNSTQISCNRWKQYFDMGRYNEKEEKPFHQW